MVVVVVDVVVKVVVVALDVVIVVVVNAVVVGPAVMGPVGLAVVASEVFVDVVVVCTVVTCSAVVGAAVVIELSIDGTDKSGQYVGGQLCPLYKCESFLIAATMLPIRCAQFVLHFCFSISKSFSTRLTRTHRGSVFGKYKYRQFNLPVFTRHSEGGI